MALQVFNKALNLIHGITTEKHHNFIHGVNQQGLELPKGTTTKSSPTRAGPRQKLRETRGFIPQDTLF